MIKSVSTLPFIAALALAACGDAETYPDETRDADREEVSSRSGDDLVEVESEAAETRAETGTDIVEQDLPDIDNPPPVTAQIEGGTVPAGPLSAGSWHDIGARGVGFGAAQSEPIVAFRCATDSDELIVTLTGEIQGAEAEPRGTVVSDRGTAVGYLRQTGPESATIEMRIAATDPALRDLAIGDRIAVAREGADTVLVTADPMLIDTLETCRG